MDDHQDLYTLRQVASICKVTLRRVNRWLSDGDITGIAQAGQMYLTRERLRLFMVSRAMDVSRLPQAAEVVAARRDAEAKAAIAPPEVQAVLRRVAALETYVRDLRTKLFYRDGFKAADRLLITDKERDAIEIENTASKRRWDAETERLLSASAGMK